MLNTDYWILGEGTKEEQWLVIAEWRNYERPKSFGSI
jgi:hypothetical protein